MRLKHSRRVFTEFRGPLFAVLPVMVALGGCSSDTASERILLHDIANMAELLEQGNYEVFIDKYDFETGGIYTLSARQLKLQWLSACSDRLVEDLRSVDRRTFKHRESPEYTLIEAHTEDGSTGFAFVKKPDWGHWRVLALPFY